MLQTQSETVVYVAIPKHLKDHVFRNGIRRSNVGWEDFQSTMRQNPTRVWCDMESLTDQTPCDDDYLVVSIRLPPGTDYEANGGYSWLIHADIETDWVRLIIDFNTTEFSMRC